MKAHYRAFGGRLVFEVEAETQKALVKSIAALHDIFELETACGCCGKEPIHLNVRTVDNNEFYAWLCVSCGAQLSLGQHKTGGTLFVKRTAPNGDPLPDRGWKRFERLTRKQSSRVRSVPE